jgi:hypothetical protein
MNWILHKLAREKWMLQGQRMKIDSAFNEPWETTIDDKDKAISPEKCARRMSVSCSPFAVFLSSFEALLFLLVAVAEPAPAEVLPRIGFPGVVVSDIEAGGGYLYAAVTGQKAGSLTIIHVRGMASEDMDAKGAIRLRDTNANSVAAYRLVGPDEQRPGDASARVVGAIRCEVVGTLKLDAPIKCLALSGDMVFAASSPSKRGGKRPAHLFSIDASDKTSPKIDKKVQLSLSEIADITTNGKHVAISGDDQVLVYQTANLEAPEIKLDQIKDAAGLSLAGDLLSLGCREGLRLYRFRDGNLELVGIHRSGAVGGILIEKGRKEIWGYLCHTKKKGGVSLSELSKRSEPKLIAVAGASSKKGDERLTRPLNAAVFQTTSKGYSARQICVSDLGTGLKVFDVTYPDRPRYVGHHSPAGKIGKKDTFCVKVAGGYAYLGMKGGIEIVSLNPSVHVDFAHEFLADMERVGDYLYVVESEATKQLYVLKISDSLPEKSGGRFAVPMQVGTYRLETPADTHIQQPGERITSIVVCSRVGSLVLGAPLKRIRVIGDRAFIVSSPSYQLAAQTRPDLTDLGETQPPRLFVVNVADPREPKLLKTVPLPLSAVEDMEANASHVSIAGNGKVLIYKAASPETPAGEILAEGAAGVFLSGNNLFVGCKRGLKVFAMPGGGKAIGEYRTNPVGSLFVSDGRAFLCHPEKGGTVEILDVSKPAAIRALGKIGRNPESVYQGIEHPLDVEARGNVVCVMDYCFGLKVFDISKLTRPRYLGGHYKFSRWWKVVSFRACIDDRHAFVGLRAALEIVNLPR